MSHVLHNHIFVMLCSKELGGKGLSVNPETREDRPCHPRARRQPSSNNVTHRKLFGSVSASGASDGELSGAVSSTTGAYSSSGTISASASGNDARAIGGLEGSSSTTGSAVTGTASGTVRAFIGYRWVLQETDRQHARHGCQVSGHRA